MCQLAQRCVDSGVFRVYQMCTQQPYYQGLRPHAADPRAVNKGMLHVHVCRACLNVMCASKRRFGIEFKSYVGLDVHVFPERRFGLHATCFLNSMQLSECMFDIEFAPDVGLDVRVFFPERRFGPTDTFPFCGI